MKWISLFHRGFASSFSNQRISFNAWVKFSFKIFLKEQREIWSISTWNIKSFVRCPMIKLEFLYTIDADLCIIIPDILHMLNEEELEWSKWWMKSVVTRIDEKFLDRVVSAHTWWQVVWNGAQLDRVTRTPTCDRDARVCALHSRGCVCTPSFYTSLVDERSRRLRKSRAAIPAACTYEQRVFPFTLFPSWFSSNKNAGKMHNETLRKIRRVRIFRVFYRFTRFPEETVSRVRMLHNLLFRPWF